MEPTHTITLRIELPVVVEDGRHPTELVTAAESYIDRVNTYLGEADARHQWSTIFDSRGVPVAELTEAMKLTGVAVEEVNGKPLVHYLSAIIDD